MIKKRGCGILLHITSLPSKYGIGDLGPGAYRFVDFLERAGQGYWQILPLNRTALGSGNSPYSSVSAFAGNTWLISPEFLVRDGHLTVDDIKDAPKFPDVRVDYNAVIGCKTRLLERSWARFKTSGRTDRYEEFTEANQSWLDDHALFLALREHFYPNPWWAWPVELRDRKPESLREARLTFAEAIEREKFFQYLFYRQWHDLRRYCNARRIQIIGDIAIYVGHDSADVWAYPEIFKLTKDKKLCAVAGFPPDVFCKTGQFWGNPLYEWDVLKARNYDWWIERIRHSLGLYDALRIDHFRGFITYWEVPANHKTAEHGKWMDGPKDNFFNVLFKNFAFPPIIVEVLGYITPEIREYMEQLHLPGMRLLIYAFDTDDATDPYYPHNHVRNAVVYTGTHDNNTIRGWFEKEANRKQKERLFAYVGRRLTAPEVSWAMIRLAMQSVCNWAIVPMQDVLSLGAQARMNQPGLAKGQWQWRIREADLKPELAARLATLAKACGRV